MSIKPSPYGIVVEDRRNGSRYAVSDKNYNPRHHRKVRELTAKESVHSYRPKSGDTIPAQETEGSATAESQDEKGNE